VVPLHDPRDRFRVNIRLGPRPLPRSRRHVPESTPSPEHGIFRMGSHRRCQPPELNRPARKTRIPPGRRSGNEAARLALRDRAPPSPSPRGVTHVMAGYDWPATHARGWWGDWRDWTCRAGASCELAVSLVLRRGQDHPPVAWKAHLPNIDAGGDPADVLRDGAALVSRSVPRRLQLRHRTGT